MPHAQRGEEDQDVEQNQQQESGLEKGAGHQRGGHEGGHTQAPEEQAGPEAQNVVGPPTMEMTGLQAGMYPLNEWQTMQFRGESGSETTAHWSLHDSKGGVVAAGHEVALLHSETNRYEAEVAFHPAAVGKAKAGTYDLHYWASNEDGTTPIQVISLQFVDETAHTADADGPLSNAANPDDTTGNP